MMRFGNPECCKCGHVHPIGFDCAAAGAAADAAFLRALKTMRPRIEDEKHAERVSPNIMNFTLD